MVFLVKSPTICQKSLMNKAQTDQKASLACIILAAGQGTRMKSALPKVMHKVAGQPMVQHVVKSCETASKIVVVMAESMDDVRTAVAPHSCAIQKEPLGTGDAVKAAKEKLTDFRGNIIVLFGDTPLVSAEALAKLVARREESGAALVVGSFTPDDAAAYGRLVLGLDNQLQEIVELAEATEEQKKIKTCNGGIMLFDSAVLWDLLSDLKNDNAKKEYYLTDCIKLARKKGQKVMVAELETKDVFGINDRVQLAQAEKTMQNRLREAAMRAGVTMRDPSSVFLCADTKFGRDVVIEPHVVFGEGVVVGDNVKIRSFSHIEGAHIECGTKIGPFARLRAGAHIEQGARIGNFVEIKNSEIGKGTKIGHLSYIGDASIGAATNIGAGTITCNYDGYRKFRTEIGENVFVGSNTALVAPVHVGDGTLIAAGSTITKNVPADALARARAEQKNTEEWVPRFRRAQKNKSV